MELPKVVVLSVLVTGGVAAAWVGSGKAARGVKPAAQPPVVAAVRSVEQSDSARLATQVAFLQAQISDLRGEIKTAADKPEGSRVAAAEAPPEASLSIEEQRALDEARRTQRLAEVGTFFQAETRSADWARSMESTLRDSLRADDVRLDARSVECRATVCRIELNGEAATLQPKLEQLPMRVGATLPVMQLDRSQAAAGRINVYFSRTDSPISK